MSATTLNTSNKLTVYYVHFETGEMETRDLAISECGKQFTGVTDGNFPCDFCPWASTADLGTGNDWRIAIYCLTKKDARNRFIRDRRAELEKARSLLALVGVEA